MSAPTPLLRLQFVRLWFTALCLGCLLGLSACGGGGGGSGGASFVGFGLNLIQSPAGLSYAMTSAVYEVGQAIVPNRPTASGGAIERFAVAPPLPDGLALDAGTGVISGTPTAVAASAVYVVTAENAGGSATARVQIEVRSTPAAPAGLTYRESAAIYTVGVAIAANAPASSGGPITGYSIAPALPAGLLFDPQTGVISGTPTGTAADAAYLITGNNATGSAVVTLRIAVQAAPVAPASVAYATPRALYSATQVIVPNTAVVTGGTPSAFSVAPALPAGLSLNSLTGAITGTPAAIQPLTTYTVTGSNSAGSAQAQVQIAVTGSGSWALEPTLPTGRHYAPVVRLSNGKAMVIGGATASGATASVVLYDPAAHSWTAAASMSTPRSDGAAIVLLDGRVLVAGGDSTGSSTVASAEIYDPAADTWQPVANMAEPRTRSTITRLPDGKVLVIGGYSRNPGLTFSQTAELYDPVTGTWTTMATQLSSPRAQHAAQLLPGGNEVLVLGGVNQNGFVTSAERFPVNDSGAVTPVAGPVPAANVYTSVLLAGGDVLAMGDGSTTSLRFNTATSSWTVSSFSSTRGLPTMTTLADGRVLLAGGAASGGVRLTTAEIYNPDFDLWTPASSMATGRSAASAVLLGDGSVLMVGGFSGSGEVDGAERFLP